MMQSKKTNTIHIAFSVHDLSHSYNYINSTAVASAVMNCSVPITVHILCDENLNKDKPEYSLNKERYYDLCKKYGAELEFHHVNVPKAYYTFPTTEYLTVGTYYRLYAADVLSAVDKVIYFDGDIIVNLDLIELWNLEMDDYCLAARADPIFQKLVSQHPKKTYAQYHRLGFTDIMIENYFNSGILVVDLNKIREKYQLSQLSEEFILSNPSSLLADQDALNYIFGNKYRKLSKKYNHFSYENDIGPDEQTIIHYCNYKPWSIIRSNTDYIYWNYASQTRWSTDNPSEYLRNILSVANMTEDGLINYRKYRFCEKLRHLLVILKDLIKHFYNYIIDKMQHKY